MTRKLHNSYYNNLIIIAGYNSGPNVVAVSTRIFVLRGKVEKEVCARNTQHVQCAAAYVTYIIYS